MQKMWSSVGADFVTEKCAGYTFITYDTWSRGVIEMKTQLYLVNLRRQGMILRLVAIEPRTLARDAHWRERDFFFINMLSHVTYHGLRVVFVAEQQL